MRENTILLYGSLGERKWDAYEGTLIPYYNFPTYLLPKRLIPSLVKKK